MWVRGTFLYIPTLWVQKNSALNLKKKTALETHLELLDLLLQLSYEGSIVIQSVV